ncbi:radical SAM protein [Lachnospiraceae bacterium NSJ-143]|nr:radical SAM protein [Lachnospiraceae bacterium NSJ-143]
MNTFETGTYRPPMHSFSLLLRVTENCPWNKCNFCMLYRGYQFKTRPLEDVLNDIDSMASIKERILSHTDSEGNFDMPAINQEYFSLRTDKERECYAMVFNWAANGNMEAIFLQDGNTMVLRTDKLLKIVERIKEKFPELNIIASYGRADSLCSKSPDELKALKNAGLNMIHSGFETCCNETLNVINKGFTAEQELEAGLKLKDAGITINLFYMPGNGGEALTEKNAADSARVMKKINPEYIRIRTFMMKEGSPLYAMNSAGTFRNMTEDGKVKELRSFIDMLDGCTSYVISDHIINLLPYVEGYIDKSRKGILDYIDEYLALDSTDKKRFQLARRIYYINHWNDLDSLNASQLSNIDYMIKNVPDGAPWEKLILSYASKLI